MEDIDIYANSSWILKMLEFRLDTMEDIGIYTNSGWNGKNAQILVATL